MLCKECNKEFKQKRKEQKYCSRYCVVTMANKLSVAKTKGSKIGPMPLSVRRKVSESKKGVSIWGGVRKGVTWMLGEKNTNWKGDSVGYDALHDWINRYKGKATICKLCGDLGGKKGCHWANISRQYRRDLGDYISLCPKCHKNIDILKIDILSIGLEDLRVP